MPAQSPTLSPTLSAITAGLRGSSSGMPGLDLADEVGADVGGLREDAAAEPGEDGDQRAAEAEPDQRVDRRLRAVVEERREHAVVAGDADEREADDEQAGDRAAAEGDAAAPARRRRAPPRRRARSRAPTRSCRCSRSSRRGCPPIAKPAATAMFCTKISATNSTTPTAGDRRVLAVQVRAGAGLDGGGDRLHALVAGREREQRARGERTVEDRAARADERDHDSMVRQEVTQGGSSLR